MTGDLQLMINRYGLKDPVYQLEIPAEYFGRGWSGLFETSANFDYWVKTRLTSGWVYKEEWSNGYRSVYVNKELRAILTYVEGDVDLTVDADMETFGKRLDAAADFYAKY